MIRPPSRQQNEKKVYVRSMKRKVRVRVGEIVISMIIIMMYFYHLLLPGCDLRFFKEKKLSHVKEPADWLDRYVETRRWRIAMTGLFLETAVTAATFAR